MIQEYSELNSWHNQKDPWDYENSADDIKRRNILLSEIPQKHYETVLDIGCGQGFITQSLPGNKVYGVDISANAIKFAKQKETDALKFLEGSIFDITKIVPEKFDLIIITGVLYQQYIGKSTNLIYQLIDEILKKDGVLISVHIDDWYYSQFPYLRIKELFYKYRTYNHKLEIYHK